MRVLSVWWLVVNVIGGSGGDQKAVTKGPFASQSTCMAVARGLDPDDRRFWPKKELVAVQDREQAQAFNREQEAYKRFRGRAEWMTLSDGTSIHINERGQIDGWAGGMTTMRHCPCYNIVSECEKSDAVMVVEDWSRF